MERNFENINLQIDNVRFGCHEDINIMRIEWSSDKGFGEYNLMFSKEGIIGDSEFMDSNNDKEFLKKLFLILIEKIQIK